MSDKQQKKQEFFTQEQIEIFKKYAGVDWNKDLSEHKSAQKIIKEAHSLLKQWALDVRKELFPDGPSPSNRINALDQANPKKFRAYLPQTLQPSKDSPEGICYWFILYTRDGTPYFKVSLGFVDDLSQTFREKNPGFNNQRRILENEYGGADKFEERFQAQLPASEALQIKMDGLSNWAVSKINKFPLTYKAICEKLGLTNQQKSNTEGKVEVRVIPLNKILYGPPGTGKTYITAKRAIEICDSEFTPVGNIDQEKRKCLMGKYKELQEKQIAFVTFHQSYGYEEFVEGLRPVITQEKSDNENKGQVLYEIHAGAFKALCEKAREEKDKNFVIIIDEINRGNISKIFGELISLLEEDKREGQLNELYVTLPYSQNPFSIPVNVYVIGTMNTADRSLAQVDIALRRRFHFEEMMPNYTVLKNLNVKGINVEEMLETINKRIEALYDRDHIIGHAYFTCLAEIIDEDKKFEQLKEIFKFKVMPLLQEYFFDDWQKIKLVLGEKFVKENLVDFTLFDKSEQIDLSDKKLYRFDDKALNNPDAYKAISHKKNSKAENDASQA